MTREEKIRFLVLRSIGNFLLLISLYGVVLTFGPALFFEIEYRAVSLKGIHYEVASTAEMQAVAENRQPPPPGYGFGALLSQKKNDFIIPTDTEFGIVIPKIGANSRVIPNIDANDPGVYLPALMQGVAHAKGSVFPGIKGTTYLFAHSTDSWWDVSRYNAVFFLLKDLNPGDEVVVFFENKRHNYVVQNKVITDPDDVSRLVNSHQGTEEKLVLQTCWPPGTDWKRLYIEAVPKKT